LPAEVEGADLLAAVRYLPRLSRQGCLRSQGCIFLFWEAAIPEANNYLCYYPQPAATTHLLAEVKSQRITQAIWHAAWLQAIGIPV
jgi:hypothetical protein